MREITWKVNGYDSGKCADILECYINGVLYCTFTGYRRDNAGYWVIYPRQMLYRSARFPTIKKLYYDSAKRR